MKANLKNILGLAALGTTLLATTIPTLAGYVTTSRVSIGGNQVSRWASGSVVDARYSADTREQIGCRAQILSTYSWTTCYAMDSAGRSLTCGSGDWKFLDMVHGMTDSSQIYFETNNTSSVGACTNIMIANSSDLLK
jgi:hypothetical protein